MKTEREIEEMITHTTEVSGVAVAEEDGSGRAGRKERQRIGEVRAS